MIDNDMYIVPEIIYIIGPPRIIYLEANKAP